MVFVMQSDLLHHTMSVSENHVWHGILIENIDTEYNYSILMIKRLGKLYGFDPAVNGCSGLIWMAGQWLYCPAMMVA